MPTISHTESSISIPGTRTQFRLRYLTGGSGAPLVLLHTVRTRGTGPALQPGRPTGIKLPNAEYTQVRNAGHILAPERPEVPADLLNSVA